MCRVTNLRPGCPEICVHGHTSISIFHLTRFLSHISLIVHNKHDSSEFKNIYTAEPHMVDVINHQKAVKSFLILCLYFIYKYYINKYLILCLYGNFIIILSCICTIFI